jgi:hypothetical protein
VNDGLFDNGPCVHGQGEYLPRAAKAHHPLTLTMGRSMRTLLFLLSVLFMATIQAQTLPPGMKLGDHIDVYDSDGNLIYSGPIVESQSEGCPTWEATETPTEQQKADCVSDTECKYGTKDGDCVVGHSTTPDHKTFYLCQCLAPDPLQDNPVLMALAALLGVGFVARKRR